MVGIVIAFLSLYFIFITDGIPVKPNSNGKLVEGDMIFPPGFNPKSSTRGVGFFGDRKWPNGIVPYDISAITDSRERQSVIDAMNTLMYDVGTPIRNSDQRIACVHFRPRTVNDKVYLKIQYGDRCSASIGYVTNFQLTMNLKKYTSLVNSGCFKSEIIQHELLHVLGFFHEQSRPDRDDYIQVHLENVDPNIVENFDKYVWGPEVVNQGSPYDYGSIMHYGTTAFSMNGKPTMLPRRSGVSIGNAKELSPIDIAEVRHYYGCSN